ncbi:14435_t:CDS:2 [Funneliformis geosporum]|uniref:12935_t:CDS:1 n=1 Tax=Funneliformis geosporum TaxID=1117311 RepID=A0A9W4SIS3_9GLOM|nr:12935_t:CDS:2 [Funneliformis geosporum]CAI2182930.1 14435_t:CDS:2 [Funneliformis geosporum]
MAELKSSDKNAESFHPKLENELKLDAEIRNLWSESIHCRNQRQMFDKANEIYDFIIVGAGTAGCVLARELIYNISNVNILVLEAGPSDVQVNDKIRLPCTLPSIYRASETDWGYYTEEQRMQSIIEPTKEVLIKRTPYPRGKVIGGCSTINSMVYMRGQKSDYDSWAAQGPEYKIWDYDHCFEAFKSVENNARENPDEEFKKYHGFNGQLHVQDSPNDTYEMAKDFIKVANNLGIPYNNDFNGATQTGIGKHQLTMKDGKRFSLADAYLTDALKKVEKYPPLKPLTLPYGGIANGVAKIVAVNVKSFAHMLSIIWDEEKEDENIAIGVKYFCNGGIHNAFIAPKGEVIICGGAINSAQILMLSGIGPKNNLEANNIKVRKELPIGRNLLDHPLCYIIGKVSNPNGTNDSRIHSWCCGIKLGINYKGNVEGKIPSKDELLDDHPDFQSYVNAIVFDPIIDDYIRSGTPEQKFEAFTLASVLNFPSSVGHLELCSSNPFMLPKLFLNYYEKPEDMYRMISSLKLLREIIKQPPLSTVWAVKEIGLNDEFGKWCSVGEEMSDEDWERYIREKTSTASHTCGTVKMAPESQGGCVNHRLQVYGTKNLRVVDASIIPFIPNTNTNAPVAMIAWRASKLIEEDYRNKI